MNGIAGPKYKAVFTSHSNMTYFGAGSCTFALPDYYALPD
jgi:hypothetical protein